MGLYSKYLKPQLTAAIAPYTFPDKPLSVWAPGFDGVTSTFVTRREALSVPACSRGRNVIVGTAASQYAAGLITQGSTNGTVAGLNLVVDANHANGIGLAATTRSGDLRNYFNIIYNNNGNQSYVAEDLTSQSLYGTYGESFTSRIKHTADAEALADRYIELRANPYPKFESITFVLGNPEIDNADRDALINIGQFNKLFSNLRILDHMDLKVILRSSCYYTCVSFRS